MGVNAKMITFSLMLLLAWASFPATGRAQSDQTQQPISFSQFIDKNRATVSVGLLNVVRKLQSRIEQFRFSGIPPGAEIDFNFNITDESPMISLGLSADTRSLAAGESPLRCEDLLNLMRYLLADYNSSLYAQGIKSKKLQLDAIDGSIARKACNSFVLGMSSVLDRKALAEMSKIDVRSDICRNEVTLEGIIGSSANGDIVRCNEALRPAS